MTKISSVFKGRLGFTSFAVDGSFDELLEFASRHGFGLVQVALDNSRYFPERINPDERRRISESFKKQGIGLCFHGPSDIPLMNRHRSVRLAGLERLYEMLDMAVEMGGEYFIFHPGRLAFYSISRHQVIFMEQKIPGRHIELFSDSVSRLLDYAAERIKLCIENTHTVPQQFLDRIARMADEDGLNLVWDAGHTELASPAKRERIIKFFQENIRRVKLGHLHDVSDGAAHRALGTGKVNITGYLEIFDTIGADVILEVFPESELLKSVEYIKNLESVHKPK